MFYLDVICLIQEGGSVVGASIPWQLMPVIRTDQPSKQLADQSINPSVQQINNPPEKSADSPEGKSTNQHLVGQATNKNGESVFESANEDGESVDQSTNKNGASLAQQTNQHGGQNYKSLKNQTEYETVESKDESGRLVYSIYLGQNWYFALNFSFLKLVF